MADYILDGKQEINKLVIYGIEGGIGTGKTMSLVYFLLDHLNKGKKIYTNIKIKNVRDTSKIEYLTKEMMQTIFELIKEKKMSMKNSSVFIQEMHNYIDSRNSASKRNKAISYWILQSRHTGLGSCDIYYDTQELGQVDLRLRRNTDYLIRPLIVRKKDGKPDIILLKIRAKIRHTYKEFTHRISIAHCLDKFSTHEVVDF